MINYQIRRKGAALGLFNPGEIGRLIASGKLHGTDELERSPGDWIPLSLFMAGAPAATAVSPAPVALVSSSGTSTSRNFYVHSRGVRNGPLELSKISGLVATGILDASAMLEDVASPGVLMPISQFVAMPMSASSSPTVTSSTQPSYQPTSYTQTTSYSSSSASTTTTGSVSSKPKVTYLQCWWTATCWIYVALVVIGFLGGNVDGMIGGLVVGLLVAPIKGAFWGWIIWLIKK